MEPQLIVLISSTIVVIGGVFTAIFAKRTNERYRQRRQEKAKRAASTSPE